MGFWGLGCFKYLRFLGFAAFRLGYRVIEFRVF